MQGRYVIVQMNNGEDGLHLKEVTAFGFKKSVTAAGSSTEDITTSTETPSSTSKESATTSKCQK